MVNKKIFYISAVISLLIIGIGVYAYTYTSEIPNPGMGGDKVLVSVGGFKMTLQEAITHGVLVDGASATQSYTTQAPNPGHIADDIYVSVDGNEMSLQDAINGGGGLRKRAAFIFF